MCCAGSTMHAETHLICSKAGVGTLPAIVMLDAGRRPAWPQIRRNFSVGPANSWKKRNACTITLGPDFGRTAAPRPQRSKCARISDNPGAAFHPDNAGRRRRSRFCDLASVDGPAGIPHSHRHIPALFSPEHALFEALRFHADALFDLLQRRICNSWDIRRPQSRAPRVSRLHPIGARTSAIAVRIDPGSGTSEYNERDLALMQTRCVTSIAAEILLSCLLAPPDKTKPRLRSRGYVVQVINENSSTPDTIDRAAAIHRCSGPHRFSSRRTGDRARSQHDAGPSDATRRIVDVLAVHHRACGATADHGARNCE